MLKFVATRPLAVLVGSAVLWGGIHCLASAAQTAGQPYSKESIVRLLKGKVHPTHVAELARERGIDFQVTPEVEGELRRAGADDSLLATLRELAPKLPEKPTEIVVQTSPAAEVYVDGQFAGRASSQGRLVVPNLTAGDHNVRLSLAGKRDYAQHVKVRAGEPFVLQASLVDSENVKPAVGTVRENPIDGLKYAWILPGTFTMGCSPGDSQCSPEENPPHPVTITKGFWMGQTEVTVGAYKRFVGATGRQMPREPSSEGRSLNPGWSNVAMPMVGVTWAEAQVYCFWAGGRLPTEAEWEYAARGGSTSARYGDLDEIAWCADNSGSQRLDSTDIWFHDQVGFRSRLSENGNGMHEVGRKRANGFALYDVLGNVWEWVNDWYDENYYQHSPSQDPPGPSVGTRRVLRGGAWNIVPVNVRVSFRYKNPPATGYNGQGFRCAGNVLAP